MILAAHDDKSSQLLQLAAKRPRFVAIGDRGPQPLWVRLQLRDGCFFVDTGRDGTLVLQLGHDALNILATEKDADMSLAVGPTAEFILGIESHMAHADVGGAPQASTAFDALALAIVSLAVNQEAETKLSITRAANSGIEIKMGAMCAIDVKVDATQTIDVGHCLRRSAL